MHRIVFQAGPLTLYSYGLCIAIAFLLSAVLMLRNSRRFGIPADDVYNCLIAIMIGGLIGGRLLFVFINREFYLRYPLRAIMFYEGGLAFQGALVMAVLSGAVVARVKKIPFWKMSDLIAPYIALGQAIGRIGCFLNGCCYGRVIEKGIAVTFPQETAMRIPTQLYSSMLLMVIFMVLIAIREKRRFDGCVFIMYVLLYAVFRFCMDFLRGDDLAVLFGIRLSQVISIGMFIAAAAAYMILSNANKRRERLKDV
jgi:phosphatidylglycerol:prolipoprotein diacylglycerol transferase